ncbi:MAG TPA: TolC family protein [Terriglobia bacterium]|nr:TolC family protein [Terriglobia bacterium]
MLRQLGKTSDFFGALAPRLAVEHHGRPDALHAEGQKCASWVSIVVLAAVLVFLSPLGTRAGQQPSSPKLPLEINAGQATAKPQAATPLATLIEEAEHNNPRIIAARRDWQAATQVPSQVSTLPDPQFTIQQFAVGSPRPFAGFSNSNFAYIGFGISQDVPYPGKLRLKGEIAKRGAVVTQDEFDLVRRQVIEQLKAAYFQLSYIQQTLGILERDQRLLAEVEKIAEARYRVGEGNQQDVLNAQLQETKLLPEIALHHQRIGMLEARLKQLLNRPADSPDLTAEVLTETPFAYTADQLMALVRNGNPNVQAAQETVRQQGLQVSLAHKDFYPDFNVQYMWQHNAEQFRDYYMLTFGVQLPIHWRRKQRPHLAQEVEELDSSRRSYEAQVQQAYFDVRDQYLAAQTDARVLTIYRQGLIPQAAAAFNAGLAAYQTGREDFQTLLGSFLDVLNLDLEYWRTLADHETALAQLEQITGTDFH